MRIDRTIRLLFNINIALAVIGVGTQVVATSVGEARLHQLHLRSAILTFNLDAEANVPTWYSSILLAASAAVLAYIALNRRNANQTEWKSWRSAAGFFAFLSLDECASIHNMCGTIAGLVLHIPGQPVWPFVAMIVLAIGIRVFRDLKFPMDAEIRGQFRLAIFVYLLGTLGVEQIGLYLMPRVGEHALSYILSIGIEESLEMFGATLFLNAALRQAAACANPVVLPLMVERQADTVIDRRRRHHAA